MTVEVWCQSDTGIKRETNQDSFIFDRDLGLYAVADGMGGHRGGEVASKLAVDKVLEVISLRKKHLGRHFTPAQLLQEAFTHASHTIFDMSYTHPEYQGMGTTLVVALYHEGVLFIGNVGDSRAYLYKEPHLWQVTEDHSLMNEQLRMGLITEQNIEGFIGKNVITRSVGFERDVDCDVYERIVSPKECFLLCSDGLSGLVSHTEIAGFFQKLRPSEIVPLCIQSAREAGGDDNITAMVLYARP